MKSRNVSPTPKLLISKQQCLVEYLIKIIFQRCVSIQVSSINEAIHKFKIITSIGTHLIQLKQKRNISGFDVFHLSNCNFIFYSIGRQRNSPTNNISDIHLFHLSNCNSIFYSIGRERNSPNYIPAVCSLTLSVFAMLPPKCSVSIHSMRHCNCMLHILFQPPSMQFSGEQSGISEAISRLARNGTGLCASTCGLIILSALLLVSRAGLYCRLRDQVSKFSTYSPNKTHTHRLLVSMPHSKTNQRSN